MHILILVCWTMISIASVAASESRCGCKSLRPCYKKMLDILQEQDEAYCIEEASIGTSTLTVFLQALLQFCNENEDIQIINGNSVTHDLKRLYAVQISIPPNPDAKLPVIVIDAGQEAGTEPVRFALYIIEQLIACQENEHMLSEVKWVIMPSTNPDGLEYSRFKADTWRKNLRTDADDISFGVDVSRNFDAHWSSCPTSTSPFSSTYPGTGPVSELETSFIKSILDKFASQTKIYLSLRRDGHHIGYPYAYSQTSPREKKDQLEMIAAEVAHKVNTRSGGVHNFQNNSIYELHGKEYCGHSVDYAYSLGIHYSFEMRIFLESDNQIMTWFHTLPRGYENSLRNGYFSGIRELYSVVTNKKKYGKLWQ